MNHIKRIAMEASLVISSPDTGLSGGSMSASGPQENISPEIILKDVFGYDCFRSLQREVIQNVLDGRDSLAVMPTGGGKSLCYEIPALIMKGLTVVVSPLIALMQDQVEQLKQLGIPAVFLNSSQEWEEYRDTCDRIRRGEIKLLYVSPEGLNTGRMTDLLHADGVTVDCITVDEAHCISSWGHDFRPDYLEIASIREQFPKAVCLALTATATKQVREDILTQLHMQDPAVLVSSFNRPNIFLEVKRKQQGLMQVMSFIRQHSGESGIIYCLSRKQVDELTQALTQNKIFALNYHAGLSDEQRTKNQSAFIKDKVDVMVCTLAFGMGINKPDVRYVIHYDLPKSLEQYYQEIGRAGRDGLEAHALLLYSYSDVHRIRFIFDEDNKNQEVLLKSMVDYADSRTCRRKFILNYFGEQYNGSCSSQTSDNCCDVCSRGPAELKDMTVPFQKYLSCIVRTHERFGATYIIDVLLGSKNERIIQNGHDMISTYGIGKELKKSQWQDLNTMLLQEGYIGKTEEHSVLFLTPLGQQKLRSREQILLPMDFEVADVKKKKVSTPVKLNVDDEEGKQIAERLKTWRRKMADEMNVPPYVIFGDKTMIDIASKKPRNLTMLLECNGIGQAKAERFGSSIIRIVQGE